MSRILLKIRTITLLLCSLLFFSTATVGGAADQPYTWRLQWLELGTEQRQAVQNSISSKNSNEILPEVLVIWLDPQQGYHTYAHKPGADAFPTQVGLFSAQGQAVPMTPWYGRGVDAADSLNPGQMVPMYEGSTPVFITFSAETLNGLPSETGALLPETGALSPSAGAGTLSFALTGAQVNISLLACSDKHCFPVKQSVPVAEAAATAPMPAATWELLRASTPGNALAQPIKRSRFSAAGTASGAAQLELAGLKKEGLENADLQDARLEDAGLEDTGLKPGTRAELSPATDPASPLLTEESQKDLWNFTPQFSQPELEVTGLGKALLFGLIAGLLLNIMPCVLPVLTLKLSTLISAHAGETEKERQLRRSAFRSHNLFFAAGILTWFVALALLFGLADMAWGQIFQNIGVVSAMLLLVFALGLSLFGVFHLPVLDLRVSAHGSPHTQAYASGLLATLLATPCSGPLLGGVLGWSLLQSMPVLVTVFVATGAGMALPYLIMAAFPAMVHCLPRAGAWMLTLERLLGFFVMGTCIYLLSILPQDLYLPMLAVLLVTAMAASAWGHWGSFHSTGLKRVLVGFSCLGAVAISLFLSLSPPEPKLVHWEEFQPESFQSLLGQEALFLEFTADWCPTCKVLESTSLAPDHLLPLVEQYGLRLIRVDLTRLDPEKQALLRALGSASIPLSAIFSPKAPESPTVLRDIYSPAQLTRALKQALGS